MFYQVRSRGVFPDFLGAFLLFFSLYLGSGSLYLFLEGGARLENYISTAETGWVNFLFGLCIILLWFYIFFATLLRRGLLKFNGGVAISVSLLFFMLSSVWAEFPYVSLGVGLFLTSWYFFINAYIAIAGRERVLNFTTIFLLSIVIISVVAALFFPSYGVSVGVHEGSWQGVFTHKNRFGYIAVLSLVFLFFSNWSLFLKLILGAICAFSTYKSNSNAAVGFLILLPLLILLWSVRFGRFRLSFYFLCFVIISLICIGGWAFINVDPEFLNNRGRIWSFVISRYSEAPLLGHGLHQYPKFAEVYSDLLMSSVGFYVRSTHNGFLDAFFSFGALAVVFIFVFFAKIFSENRGGLFGFLFGLFMINLNMVESNLFSVNIFFMILILLVCCGGVSESDRVNF